MSIARWHESDRLCRSRGAGKPLSINQFSVDGLRGLTTARIQQRFAELAELAHFERVRL